MAAHDNPPMPLPTTITSYESDGDEDDDEEEEETSNDSLTVVVRIVVVLDVALAPPGGVADILEELMCPEIVNGDADDDEDDDEKMPLLAAIGVKDNTRDIEDKTFAVTTAMAATMIPCRRQDRGFLFFVVIVIARVVLEWLVGLEHWLIVASTRLCFCCLGKAVIVTCRPVCRRIDRIRVCTLQWTRYNCSMFRLDSNNHESSNHRFRRFCLQRIRIFER
jgi:hypothetical protein